MNNLSLALANSQWYISLFLFFSPILTNAQTLRLLDAVNQQPIAEATYEYQTQSGTSDKTGTISIQYQEGATLFLSHVSYGNWHLNDQQLKEALEVGMIYREETIIDMQLVTVLALRSKLDEAQGLTLSNQDRLAHDGAAILNRLPSISSIRKSGSYGFDPVMRGFKYDQLNIVINGAQSATAACPNRMDPPTSQVAPNMMDRIEIFKGPHSLRYGNSFGGTINFVPLPPRFTEKAETYGRLSGNYESNGNILRNEGLLGFNGRKYDLSFFASWSEGDDYQDGEGHTVPADFLRASFGSKLGLKISDRQLLELSAARNLARDADFPALPMDLRKDDTWLLNARHEVSFDKEVLQSWNTTIYATLVQHLMDNLLKPLDPRMMNASTDATTRTYGGRTEGEWTSGKGKLFAGLDLRVEEAQGTRFREFLMGPNAGKTFTDNAWQESQISRSALFGEYHLKSHSLHFVLSGRLEMNHAKLAKPELEFTEVYPTTEVTDFNPSFSLGGINNFANGISVGLWLGRAQRSASITERYINYFPVGLDPYEMLGNPELRQEVNNQLDLTLGYRSSKTSIEVGVFTSFLQDYISSEIVDALTPRLSNSPGVRQFINIDRAQMAGFELSWKQKLWKSLDHQLQFAYTYGQNQDIGEPLPEIAPLDFRYTLLGAFLQHRLRPEFTFRQVIAQNRVAEVFGETKTPAFTLVDVNMRYQISPLLSVTAGVQNLFDEAYYEHLSRSVRGVNRPIYAPGRNIFFSLTIDLM